MAGSTRRWGYWAATLAVAVVAAAGVAMSAAGLPALRDEAARVRAEVESETAAVEARSAEVDSARGEVARAVTGVDAARVAADSEIIESLARVATTWGSQAEYDAARVAVVSEYGVDEDGRFMTTFLPAMVPVRDAAGNSYSVIDQKELNCHFVSARPILCGVDGDEYSYFVVVSATGSRAGASAGFTAAILCSVGADGELSGVDGYTLQ